MIKYLRCSLPEKKQWPGIDGHGNSLVRRHKKKILAVILKEGLKIKGLRVLERL